MFRRRTDQVYSTLQQVQRRITEQGGNNAPPLPPSQPAYTSQPRSDSAGVNLQPLYQALPNLPPPPPVDESPAAALAGIGRGRRQAIQLSVSLASTIGVLWLFSCVLFFVIGRQYEKSQVRPTPPSNPGAGFAAGDAGYRELAAPVETVSAHQGNALLILEAKPVANAEVLKAQQARADQLNEFVRKQKNTKWAPYFGVRQPVNGGTELVFGMTAPGVFGVAKDDFKDFARTLAAPAPSGGGFVSAKWITLP